MAINYKRPSVTMDVLNPLILLVIPLAIILSNVGFRPLEGGFIGMLLGAGLVWRHARRTGVWEGLDPVKCIQATPCARCGGLMPVVDVEGGREGDMLTLKASARCLSCPCVDGIEMHAPQAVGMEALRAMGMAAMRDKWTHPTARRNARRQYTEAKKAEL